LIKPIDPDELINILNHIANDLLSINEGIELGNNYQFDKSRKVLIKNDETISLTKKELLFVSILIKNIGKFVSHEDIKEYVWTSKNVTDVAIRTFIKRIREKTEKNLIKNISGLGYKINSDE
jgi:DNA-binding response OmpR family regulator